MKQSWIKALCVGVGLAGCDAAIVGEAPVEPVIVADTPMAEVMMEPVLVEEHASVGLGRRPASQGVVTAGDIDDTLNLAAFSRYQARQSKALGLKRANLLTPVQIQLVGRNNKPLPGMHYTLRKPGAAEPFHSGYAGVDGRISVFPASLGQGRLNKVELRTFSEIGTMRKTMVPTGQGWERVRRYEDAKYSPDFVDLVFVFDTTGSMGDELAWLTKEFKGIVSRAKQAAPGADFRFGLVAYRDKGDAYEVQNYGFTLKQSQMQRWLRGLNADGGGDYPEAADRALRAAVDLNWKRGKGERLIFHVADAPPHKSNSLAYTRAAQIAAGKGVQIFGLGASGVGDEAEFLMRQASLVSGGRYLFLTDDSGVGQAHAEPKVACYRVTRLKALLSRVLASELTGKRVEAAQSEVIRSVGAYSDGFCQQ